MKAICLQTGYLTNPIGIDLTEPLLTWQAQDGKKQTAYALKASVNGRPVIDTGKVGTSSMRYSFNQELHSRDVVAWRVVLWDENDCAGEESEEVPGNL